MSITAAAVYAGSRAAATAAPALRKQRNAGEQQNECDRKQMPDRTIHFRFHVATHGFFRSDQQIAQKSKTSAGQPAPFEDPMLRFGLFFAGAERVRYGAAPTPGLDDGVLTAHEASQLDLENTELVVLSACETGLGQQSNSEGVFGLRRGLQEAGADAVMMSTWSVSDRETQELMGTF